MDPVEVLVNPDCAHCLRRLDQVAAMAMEEGVPIAAIDVLHHPEVAARGGWEHSPVVTMGDGALAQVPTRTEFRRFVEAHRGPAQGI